jgi:ankyrin repeat protein
VLFAKSCAILEYRGETVNRVLLIIAILVLLPACAQREGEDATITSESPESALLEAAKGGDLEDVKELIQRGVNIDSKDKDGLTPLHHAVASDNLELLRLLIAGGADVNVRENNSWNTPLLINAVLGEHWEALKVLLEKGADLNAKDNWNRTTLHFAAWHGYTEAVDILIKRGADVNAKNRVGQTPLDKAVGQFPDVVMQLRKYGGKSGKIAQSVVEAAKRADAATVRQLVLDGADINARDRNRRTALHWAALYGGKGLVAILIDAGAQVDARDYYGTPCHLAIGRGHKDVVKLLMDAGADVSQLYDEHWTVLHLAATSGNPGMVKFVLRQPVDINVPDSIGNTPVHLAAQFGHGKVVEVLMSKGANINAVNTVGNTPLDIAEGWEHEDTCKLLQSLGAMRGEELKRGEEGQDKE